VFGFAHAWSGRQPAKAREQLPGAGAKVDAQR
jgi:hypothetical protein